MDPGTRIGPYEVTGKIGAGGMGEVYRATDTKLGRDVAIKTLPSALAGDKDRLARFEREAKLLAALNHANIASVYGLDEHDGTQFIAMELVDGQTLEDRLKHGPLPLEDALRLALQIAEALEAAHDKGVVHRDLKPANIMLTRDGTVKVLDFGLAKALSNDPDGANPVHSPALSLAMTQAGLVLGTAGYMSPEQASGQPTDQRADIWAFGVVLYEMLTGLPLFTGESVPHILADVLKSEPDWTRLPKDMPPRLKLTLARCLAKKPRNRYHSIADVRVDIEAVLSDPGGGTLDTRGTGAPADVASRSTVRRLGAGIFSAVLGAAAAGLVAWILWPAASAPVMRFSIDLLGPLNFLEPVAVSPDGRRIVYAANDQLWVRRLDQDETTAIAGTEHGSNPFFSPDGESLAFFTGTQLKATGLAGEIPRVLAAVGPPAGLVGAWDRDGRIFFGQTGSVDLQWVPAVGGEPETFAERDAYRDVDFPDVLPGGQWVLLTGQNSADWNDADILVQNVSTGERRLVLEGGYFARYLPTGHVVFARRGTLYAVGFDLATLQTVGSQVPIVQGMAASAVGGHAQYAVAANGTLVYVPGTPSDDQRSRIVSVDLDGSVTALSAELHNYASPRLSPDGMRVAIAAEEPDGRSNIWIMDLGTGRATQLTFQGSSNQHPVWTADGAEVLFTSVREGQGSIYRKAADGTGEATRVLDGTEQLVATDVLPGNVLVFQDVGKTGGRDILTFDVDNGGPAEAFLATPADESSARVSPNGAWIAYMSTESGENRVYIRPYPATTGGVRAVSEGLSAGPVWSRAGDALYFLGMSGELESAAVAMTETTINVGRPQTQFDFMTRLQSKSFTETAPYDGLPDGARIVASQAVNADGSAELGASGAAPRPTVRVVLNWFEELNRLVPVD